MTTSHPPVLIESWLPIEAIGAESQRERASMTALPPIYYLHVWWARRPLITSRAAILASVLPQWSAGFPIHLREKFPNEASYHHWFLQLAGIYGDPAQARRLLAWAKQQGRQISNPYGSAPRAFTVNPSAEDLQTMGDLLDWVWGNHDLSILDSFSGGGSIPFEALRYGFTTYANDLNPVAAVILKATLDYPARFGPSLVDDIRKWGKRWYELVKPELQPFFAPLPPDAEGATYLWARTVNCPSTGKPVPLSPNWWLSMGDRLVAVHLIAEAHMDTPRFEIVTGAQAKAINPDEGTIVRGIARSPWTGETIDGDYIKCEAQAGRMGHMLYTIAIKKQGGFDFRSPTNTDIACANNAFREATQRRISWIATGIVPGESIPDGSKTAEPIRYGMRNWEDLFSPRQQLTMAIFLTALGRVQQEIADQLPREYGDAIITYLGIALDKCPNYNSLLASWHAPRNVMRSVFDRHDLSVKWTYAEFDSSANLLPWALSQVAKAYKELADLIAPAQQSLTKTRIENSVKRLTISQGTATNLKALPSDSICNITVDPPYYDNVQYAELSDFFYVWLKRSVGHLFPEFFQDELTNKDDEAVANPARFEGMGKKKKELAEQDYEHKMRAAFKEMHRVLRPDGVLTVMFTHKRVEAWDTLASALIGAGFVIKASWPVHTESEHSLHQAKKNAASSTILLVCRKRAMAAEGQPEAVWWDDIKEQVRQVARQKAAEFSQQGIHGVDLYLSTFGPTLSILSEHWPVLTSDVDPKTGQPKPLRPELALDLAREEVVRLRKQGLLMGREVSFDPVTDWYLMAWDAFGAEQFPYDEARKLAIALGIDLDKELMQHKRIAAKKGEYIVLQTPVQRRKKGMVDDDLTSFPCWIDALHTAMMVYTEDGAGACDVFLQKSALKHDSTFKACLQALLNAVPRARIKGAFVRPEAEALENLRLAFYSDLAAPQEEEPELPEAKQLGLWDGAGAEDDEAEGES